MENIVPIITAIGAILGPFLGAGAVAVYNHWTSKDLQKTNFKFEEYKTFAADRKRLFIEFASVLQKFMGKRGLTQFDKKIQNLLYDLILYGTATSIIAWHEFGKISTPDPKTNEESLEEMTDKDIEVVKVGEKLFREFRKSIGHDDSKLPPGSLYALLITENEKWKVYEACKNEKYN